jgi:hypothetical protein
MRVCKAIQVSEEGYYRVIEKAKLRNGVAFGLYLSWMVVIKEELIGHDTGRYNKIAE